MILYANNYCDFYSLIELKSLNKFLYNHIKIENIPNELNTKLDDNILKKYPCLVALDLRNNSKISIDGIKNLSNIKKLYTDSLQSVIVRTIIKNNEKIVVLYYGSNHSPSKFYYYRNQLHRDNDLPAIIHHNGYKEWYKKNKLYRENELPVIEHASGAKYWHNKKLFFSAK